MIFLIARKELSTLFASPLAWLVLALGQLVYAWVFLVQLDQYLQNLPRMDTLANPPGVTEVVAGTLFGFAAIVLLMLVPLVSQRLFPDEDRQGTLQLLLAAPVSTTEIVLGKFLGAMLFLLAAIAQVVVMAASLALGGPVDWGLIVANVLGLLLLSAAFSSLGLFVSSLTRHGLTAAFATFAVLLLLWIVHAATEPGRPLHVLSLMSHFDAFNRGLLDTRDVAYLAVFTGVFLTLTVRRLESRRLMGA